VLLMTVALVFATRTVQSAMPHLHIYGNIIGGSISGAFLWLIGILNLVVLLDILLMWRQVRSSGNYPDERLNELLAQRGLARRLLGSRLQNFVNHSWQMYPVGMLFGLGFDTASEIALLGLAAGAAARAVPSLAIVSLALLFAAGMSLMDTADGVFMVRAYTWALSKPLRRIYYNIATTGLSVVIALLIGSIELIQVLGPALNLRGPVIETIAAVDFERIGYIIVGLFVVGWLGSVALWKFRRLDEQSESAL
jgi:nickel/cobalt transporter (NiCoT) family protein